jgi:hypothetical protein
LRYAPEGRRLFAVWSEDHDVLWQPAAMQVCPVIPRCHLCVGAFLAWSEDAGKAWSTPRRINSEVEAVQGEENGPKIAIGKNNRAYVVWSIPGEKGDKTRANIRFAMDDGKGGFTLSDSDEFGGPNAHTELSGQRGSV